MLRNGDIAQIEEFNCFYAYWKYIVDFRNNENHLSFSTLLNGRFNKIVETEFDVMQILDDEFYIEYYAQLEIEKYD